MIGKPPLPYQIISIDNQGIKHSELPPSLDAPVCAPAGLHPSGEEEGFVESRWDHHDRESSSLTSGCMFGPSARLLA